MILNLYYFGAPAGCVISDYDRRNLTIVMKSLVVAPQRRSYTSTSGGFSALMTKDSHDNDVRTLGPTSLFSAISVFQLKLEPTMR